MLIVYSGETIQKAGVDERLSFLREIGSRYIDLGIIYMEPTGVDEITKREGIQEKKGFRTRS